MTPNPVFVLAKPLGGVEISSDPMQQLEKSYFSTAGE
jgi:hypothetical protein